MALRAVARKVARRLRPVVAGTRFQAAALRRYGVDTPTVADPTLQMWIDFALSSVERGRAAVAALGGASAFSGRHVLDVGCAYGGFLVAAAEAGASRIVGIDIDRGLLELARLQLLDHRVKGKLAHDDITADGLAQRWGRFDLVLCNDVIEHVTDPARCASNLAALLKRGGRVFLEIPNGTAVDFMRRDGHYGLFGLTLLGREQAERWWRFSYQDRYGVEHYAPLGYYLDIFSRAGIALRLISPAVDPDARVPEIAAAFDDLERELAELEDPGAPDLVATMRENGAAEIGRFRDLHRRALTSQSPAERSIILTDLVNTYGLNFWTLEGTRL